MSTNVQLLHRQNTRNAELVNNATQHKAMQHNGTQRNRTQQITMQHNAMQLNTAVTQRITTQYSKTDTPQHNGSQHNATQHNIMDYNTMQHNTTDPTQQNSPQHNKTGNKNHAHMLNKPVKKVTSSSTKNSTEKKGQKMLQVYKPVQMELNFSNIPSGKQKQEPALNPKIFNVFCPRQ